MTSAHSSRAHRIVADIEGDPAAEADHRDGLARGRNHTHLRPCGLGPKRETRQPRRGYCCKAAFQDGSSVDGHRCIHARVYERVCTMTAVADFAAQRQEENSPA